MRRTKVHIMLATATALALTVGVGAAIAATGGGSLKQEAVRIADRSSFEAAVAANLGTTSTKLEAAISAAATARIDAALAANEITASEASTLKGALVDGMPAMRFATAAGVAKELGATEAKLNAAYSSAQKAQATARVDQALEDGKITAAYAAELKAKIDASTFPGFAAGGPGRHGGHGGMEGAGPGLGFGPPLGGTPPRADPRPRPRLRSRSRRSQAERAEVRGASGAPHRVVSRICRRRPRRQARGRRGGLSRPRRARSARVA